ncbi:MAG: 30S ribosomal protein S12 methylthiotransferase RimO [Elusimicrobia bacterium]|nr:30S ribosomal protein S12 methylthiotransferase RimO [Elusimicrobiota bacterium]
MPRGRVAFVVLGCAKNQVEAESMSSRLAREGWDMTADIPNADLVVVHSCGFLEAAREEARETLGHVRRAAPRAFLVLTGCFAQFLKKNSLPGVDAVLGTGQLDRLPDVLAQRSASAGMTRPTLTPSGYHDANTPRPLWDGQLSTYLRLSEGCNHRCTFCIIPQLRGSLKSRPPGDILKEGESLVQRGVRELVLISQDTTDYGSDRKGLGLVPLVKRMAVWTDLRWIRLLYAYPSEVDKPLMDLLANEPKLCGYLDMPLQHMSDRILKSMGREWGHGKTRSLLDRLRNQVTGLALRTTFIVGFPGETEADFNQVLSVVQDGYFEHVGVFPYSFETRSPSARLPGLVPPEVVTERWQRLLEAHRIVKTKKDRSRMGQTVDVLVEREPGGGWSARAAHQAPEVDGGVKLKSHPTTPGFYSCRITGVEGIHLKGELLPRKSGKSSSRRLVLVP